MSVWRFRFSLRDTSVLSTVSLGLIIVVATVLCIGGSTSRQPPPALSPVAAIAIVRSYANGWARVVSERDFTVLNQIQSGAALATTSAELKAKESAGEPRPEVPRPREVAVAVPRLELPPFPAHFLAIVTWSSRETDPYREVLEFEQVSRRTPWRVWATARLIDNIPPPPVAIDADGYAALVDARDAENLRFSARASAKLLGAYFDDHHAPDDPAIAPGPFSTGLRKQRMAANQNFQIQQVRQYQPGAFRTAAYRLSDGSALLLLALNGSRQVYPLDRQVVSAIIQRPGQQGFGGLVPPGTYGSITLQMTMMLAVTIPPAHSTRQLRVVARQEQDTRATTSPP